MCQNCFHFLFETVLNLGYNSWNIVSRSVLPGLFHHLNISKMAISAISKKTETSRSHCISYESLKTALGTKISLLCFPPLNISTTVDLKPFLINKAIQVCSKALLQIHFSETTIWWRAMGERLKPSKMRALVNLLKHNSMWSNSMHILNKKRSVLIQPM